PDGDGMWIDARGRAGLVHRRLAIIDPGPGAGQPMELEGESKSHLIISYNGEIYNFRALRQELENDGRRFRTQSDTEVLLHLYDAYGPDMVYRLRGMFAFAIWDEGRRGLFMARDPFGIKPLYFADDGKQLRAASQVKALIAGGGLTLSPGPAGHVGFFLFGYIPEPHTLHTQIKSLPAGSHLWLDEDGQRREVRYFSPQKILAEAGPPPPPDETRELLATALTDSVSHHLVADVPVGLFLSAGLDSAALTALASEAGAKDLQTVTLAFDEFKGTPRDEAPLAQRLAEIYQTDHETRRVAGADFKQDLASLLSAMDQPSIDGVNSYFVAKAAARRGLKVA
ncbi:MAG: asparagine synthase (glutamine-hydrolyzing), partial [Rhodospirillales bacterium]|nr:asparagine synthase (glutamine-hydrolyzing) [Rhodospirillales bacterium]